MNPVEPCRTVNEAISTKEQKVSDDDVLKNNLADKHFTEID